MEYLWIPFVGLVACVIALPVGIAYMAYGGSSVRRRRRRR